MAAEPAIEMAAYPSRLNLLGETVGPGYRLVALLDATGLASAYRAWDHTAERYVVVKVPRLPIPASAPDLSIAQAAICDSPAIDHVAPAIASGMSGSLPFIVSPYYAGGTLRQRRPTSQGKPLLAHPALLHSWLPAIAQALDSLHARGDLHGSVSPDTILFDHDSKPWLADYRGHRRSQRELPLRTKGQR